MEINENFIFWKSDFSREERSKIINTLRRMDCRYKIRPWHVEARITKSQYDRIKKNIALKEQTND